jgi:predicted ATPase with chaperone activity
MTTPRRTEEYLFKTPETIDDLGIGETLVCDLFLKHAYNAGTSTVTSIAASLRLPIHLAETVFRKLKTQQFIDVRGTFGEDFSFTLSASGKAAAIERMQVSRYAGPLPVSLTRYQEVVRAQVARTRLNREKLEYAYKDLMVTPELINRLGPALVAQKSMFLYGPSGTGKSSLAERVMRVHNDRIGVPMAVQVDGNVICVFDPAVHKPVGAQRGDDDPRWVMCERPSIIVGGELIPAMLELQREPDAGHFIAPLHMKANNGIFVIDDFGRQMIAPKDLLNRWIVPLDRRVDYLTISGAKFAVPFEVFVVFSTNLNPSDLADEAFLRRIPNKILVDAVPADMFDRIVLKRLESTGWTAEPGATDRVRNVCAALGGSLRPCYPRDILQIVESIAQFEETEQHLTVEHVNRAAELYFARAE